MKEVKIKRIFEDRYFLVLNKPAGCLSLACLTSNLFSLEEWMRKEYPELFRSLRNKRVDFYKRAGLVHRLDKDTTGLVLAAKDEISFLRLQNQFKERKVKKTYWALVADRVCREGEIEVPIARHKQIFGTWQANPDGFAAKTAFIRLKFYKQKEKEYSLLEIYPQTGRTHQIRVHLKYLGWPVVGDKIYGGEKLAGLKRLFLHAKKICFSHPQTGKRVCFEAKLPVDLQWVLERLEGAKLNL